MSEAPKPATESGAEAGPGKLLSPLATVLVSVVTALTFGAVVFVAQLLRRDAQAAAAVAAVAGVGTLAALLTTSFASRWVAPASRLLPWLVSTGMAAAVATAVRRAQDLPSPPRQPLSGLGGLGS